MTISNLNIGKKNIRILAILNHTRIKKGKLIFSAVDWWRIKVPIDELKKNTKWKIDYKMHWGILNHSLNKDVLKEWEDIAKKYNIVYFSYTHNIRIFILLKVLHIKYGLRFIMDFDDDLLEVVYEKNHPLGMKYVSEPHYFIDIQRIIHNSPFITVTGNTLKLKFKKFCMRKAYIQTISNYINLSVYNHTVKKKEMDSKIVIGYFGGNGHKDDLGQRPFLNAIKYILKKYQNRILFQIVGIKVSELENYPNVEFINGKADFYDWVKLWKTLQWDFAVAPLKKTKYNLSKSPIKLMEIAAMKIPIIASSIKPYEEYLDAHDIGLLADSTKEWIHHMELLIHNKEEADNMGNRAYSHLQGYTISKNWKKWKKAFESVYRRELQT